MTRYAGNCSNADDASIPYWFSPTWFYLASSYCDTDFLNGWKRRLPLNGKMYTISGTGKQFYGQFIFQGGNHLAHGRLCSQRRFNRFWWKLLIQQLFAVQYVDSFSINIHANNITLTSCCHYQGLIALNGKWTQKICLEMGIGSNLNVSRCFRLSWFWRLQRTDSDNPEHGCLMGAFFYAIYIIVLDHIAKEESCCWSVLSIEL